MDYNLLFEYRDGELYWRELKQRGFNKSGQRAGYVNKGYAWVRSNKLPNKNVPLHHVIWQMFHGPIPDGFIIDHRDRNPMNNRIDNLRLATRVQNAHNAIGKRNRKRKLPKNVYIDSQYKGKVSYRAQVYVKGIPYRVGGLNLIDATKQAENLRSIFCHDFARDGYE